ncbi:hypothetical protein FF2_030444 [Malus domestica]
MCIHHNDFGHATNDCRSLRNQVEAMLKNGMLSQYRVESRDECKNNVGLQAVTGNIGVDERLLDINVIHGRPQPPEGREARYRSQRWEAEKSRRVHNITSTPEASKALENLGVISFSQKDLEGIQFPYNDALVVTLRVANSRVKRIMIDRGSNTDVLFWSTFRRMKLNEKEIRSNPTPIYAFEGTKAQPIKDVTLPVTAADDPSQQDQENDDKKPPTIEPLRKEVLDPTDHENEYRDMPGIDSEVACHQLNVDPSCPPHRQNQRRFTPE